MDATTESIILTDTDGIILDINQQGARRLGSSPKELIGKPGWDLLAPEIRAQRAPHIKQAIRTGEPTVFRDERDGRVFDASVYPVLDREGNVYRIAVFARDMTDHVRAEQATRESEEQFRLVTEQSMLAVLIIQDQRIRFANETVATMLGRSLEKISNLSIERMAKFIHPDDREYALEQIRRAATPGTSFDRRFRVRILTERGRTMWLESLQRSTLLGGRPAALVAAVDISEQVAAEQSLKYLNRKLREEQDALEQKNIALRRIMLAVQEETSRIRDQVQSSVNRTLMPLVNDLERQLPRRYRSTIELLRTSLTEIAEPAGSELERKLVELTPREVEICRMIRNGMITKEIADYLHLAESTIEKYRHNIRKKLGLTGKNTNLRTHLLSL
jgi:PAS domain S-box-containing protein